MAFENKMEVPPTNIDYTPGTNFIFTEQKVKSMMNQFSYKYVMPTSEFQKDKGRSYTFVAISSSCVVFFKELVFETFASSRFKKTRLFKNCQ